MDLLIYKGNIVVPLQNIDKCDPLQTLKLTSSTFYMQNNRKKKLPISMMITVTVFLNFKSNK